MGTGETPLRVEKRLVGERQLRVDISQASFLTSIPGDKREALGSAADNGGIIDIGKRDQEDKLKRIIVGPESMLREFLPPNVVATGLPVIKVTMTQSEFLTQPGSDRKEGVLDIGSINEAGEAQRTIIGQREAIREMFPNAELPPESTK